MKKELKKIQEEVELINTKREAQHARAELSRARSITVGTCFGGTTEIMMRKFDGEIIWCPMQPVEVMELIHQLSANIGCLIKVIPRQDFASWRDWRLTPEEIEHYRGLQLLPGQGWPPHANGMGPYAELGASVPPIEKQLGLRPENGTPPGVDLDRKIKKDFLKKRLKKIENKEQQ